MDGGVCMRIGVRIEGINLEKLLRAAQESGVTLLSVRRTDAHAMEAQVSARDMAALASVCERCGWAIQKTGMDRKMRAVQFLRRRPMILPGAALCLLLVWLSSQMILSVRIEHTRENTAEVRRCLAAQGVRPGRMKAAFSLDSLRESLALALPGVSFAGVRYAGSVMIVDCRPAVLGETADISGEGMDIVAAQAGIITGITVSSGTPAVRIGQAVHQGQVLIRGEERTEKGQTTAVRAQGDVRARVYASASAKASLSSTHTEETGRVRTRITLAMPWRRRVVRAAEPFASQDVSVRIEPVVGLYLPLWREIETYAETIVTRKAKNRADAASAAQGAAQELAKKQCPAGALILDKWVDYSMIDNEFVYATVVLEYETSVAGRLAAPRRGKQ